MARSKEALRELAGLSKDPSRFFPEWTFPERDSRDWKNLQATHGAGPVFAEEMRSYAAELDSGDVYKLKAKLGLKAEHYAKVIFPKFQSLRNEILADLRRKARDGVILAEREALALPETPFEVAAAMRSLDRVYAGVRAGGGSKKLRLPDLEQLPPATLRAIAATDPIVSGLSDADHAAIRRQVFDAEGGKALADAREFLAAVETASEALDYGEAIAELAAGIPSRSPETEQRLAAVQ